MVSTLRHVVMAKPIMQIEVLMSFGRHLLTGIGAYFYIIWGVWLQHCLDKNQDDFDLYWPRFFTSFPVVMRRSLMKGKRGVVFADNESKKMR